MDIARRDSEVCVSDIFSLKKKLFEPGLRMNDGKRKSYDNWGNTAALRLQF
jgi:hypothetical protein